MKSVFLAAVVTATIFASSAHALVNGGPNDLGDANCGDSEPSIKAMCQMSIVVSSLPTLLVEDAEVDKTSPQYQAMAIDQAVRTVRGERTLLFGTDIAKAQKFLNAFSQRSGS